MNTQYAIQVDNRAFVRLADCDERELIATEATAVVARRLIAAIFDSIQRDDTNRSAHEGVILVDELAKRHRQESVKSLAAARNAWIRVNEQGFVITWLDLGTGLKDELAKRHRQESVEGLAAARNAWIRVPEHGCVITGLDLETSLALRQVTRARRDGPAEDQQEDQEFLTRRASIGHVLVEVASYLGVAAASGVVGNRADGVFTATARRLFRTIDSRWHQRNLTSAEPLTKVEAIRAAIAAAIARGFGSWRFNVRSATQEPDYSWAVLLEASCPEQQCRALLRAYIPAGDPCRATILLYNGAIFKENCHHCSRSF
jgi:hypothetical protein